MKKVNKKMNFTSHRKSSFVTKITCLFYIIFTIMSIACHEFSNLGVIIQEIITYTILGLMLKVGVNSINLKELKEIFD